MFMLDKQIHIVRINGKVCVSVSVFHRFFFWPPSKKKRIIRVNFGIVQTDTMCVQEYGGFATAVRQIQTSREHTHTHLILFSSQCIFYVHAWNFIQLEFKKVRWKTEKHVVKSVKWTKRNQNGND